MKVIKDEIKMSCWEFVIIYLIALIISAIILSIPVSAYDNNQICQNLGFNLTNVPDYLDCQEFINDLQSNGTIINQEFKIYNVTNQSFYPRTIYNYTMNLNDYYDKDDIDELFETYEPEEKLKEFEERLDQEIEFYEDELYKKEIKQKELDHNYTLEIMKLQYEKDKGGLNVEEIRTLVKSILDNEVIGQNTNSNEDILNYIDEIINTEEKESFIDKYGLLLFIGVLVILTVPDIRNLIFNRNNDSVPVQQPQIADIDGITELRNQQNKIKSTLEELKLARENLKHDKT